jgi:hypothetical protein
VSEPVSGAGGATPARPGDAARAPSAEPAPPGSASSSDPLDSSLVGSLAGTGGSPRRTSRRKLALEDISDLRAYEREREAFRRHVIELKARRRVGVGPIVTVVFENRDTVRFQVQEMARAERLLSDAAVEAEREVYNPLIPDPGELSATMFLELTTRAELEEWLPKLVGVERALELRIGGGGAEGGQASLVVRATPDPAHEAQLTRPDVTSSVHYVRFRLSDDEIERFGTHPVELAVVHPAYEHAAILSEATKAELLTDLVGD